MKTRLTRAVAATGIVALLAVAACGSDDDDASSTSSDEAVTETVTETVTEAPTGTSGQVTTTPSDGSDATTAGSDVEQNAGGKLRMFTISEVSSLDTANCNQSYGSGGDRMYALYGRLLDIRTGSDEFGPSLAESMTSDDATTWTLKLRDGVTFSDGTPFDAEAIKFNIERHQDPEFGSRGRATASSITAMEVVDPLTLQLTLATPRAQFPRFFTRELGCIGSPTAIQEMGDGFGAAPVTAGPFMVESWTRDSNLVLERNPTYFDEGKPYLDEITFELVVDPDLRMEAVRGTSDPAAAGEVRAEAFQSAEDDGLPVYNAPLGGGIGVTFNLAKAPFDDARLREALQLAIDADVYNDTVHGGALVLAQSPFAEGSPFWDPELVQPPADLARAQELVDEYVAENGPVEATLTMSPTQQPDGEYLATLWNTSLNDVNIATELLQTPEIIDKVYTRKDHQVAVAAVLFDDPDRMTDYFTSDSPQNFFGIVNPELDAALKAQQSALDPDERVAAMTDVQTILLEEQPMIWLYKNITGSILNNDDIHWDTWTENLPVWEEISVPQ